MDPPEIPKKVESLDIRKSGGSLVVPLTHPFKEMGLTVGDFVRAELYEDRLILRYDESKQSGKVKATFNIDSQLMDAFNGDIEEAIEVYNKLNEDNLWDVFKKVVAEHEGEDDVTTLRGLIDNHISKWTKWYRLLDRPLIKI